MLKKLISTIVLGALLITGTQPIAAATIKEKKAENAAEQRKLEKAIKKNNVKSIESMQRSTKRFFRFPKKINKSRN